MPERSVVSGAHPAYSVDWALIRSFDAVARAGSLAGGARLLGVAHPTIARHVQHLEEELGVSLFARTKQGLVLNEAGERLLDAADAMQSGALAFQNAADSVSARSVPRVRLTVSEMLAELLPHVALPAVAQLGDTSPAVEMLVTNESLNLLGREADIALRHARPTQQELICRRLGYLPVGLFASQGYLDERGKLCPLSVAQHRFVDGSSRANLVEGARSAGLMIEPEWVSFRSDALSCQRAAVAAGWGIGAFPTALAGSVDGLVNATQSGEGVHLEVWLVARPEVRENLQLKTLFDGVGGALGGLLVDEPSLDAPAWGANA